MVLAGKLLERCWYLVDLFIFPAAHEKQTQNYLFFLPLLFKVCWNSLSFSVWNLLVTRDSLQDLGKVTVAPSQG